MARYYDIDAANARLEELRPLLERLRDERDAIADAQRELLRLQTTDGSTEHATDVRRLEASVRRSVRSMEEVVRQVEAWNVTLRDIGTGLVDFPALASGRPIWLCWRLGEGDIAWWHETDEGFSARRALIDLT